MSWAKVIKTNHNAGNDLPNACHPQRLKKTLCRNEFLYKFSSRDGSAIQPRRKERSSAQYLMRNEVSKLWQRITFISITSASVMASSEVLSKVF